jgi:Fur family zinc uptake transcriptional regulator
MAYAGLMPPDDAPPPSRDVPSQLRAAAQQCADNGTQLTALRQEVLSLILRAEAPLTAYQLLDQLKEIRKTAMPPTVYRTLDFLIENRLIHRIERLNAFVSCTETEHNHSHRDAQFLICTKCGSVTEIEDHAITHALAKAAAARGFRPSHAIVELDGICGACAGSAPS